MKPHALMPTNAKELILKDADYSTPQDHYFNYTQADRARLTQGLQMHELKEAKRQEELQVIRELFGDEGRVDSIERHIQILEEERKPKTMMQLFTNLTETQKQDIERNWGTTLPELQKLAKLHDEQAAQDALLPEEKRFKKDNKMLESLNMDKLMSVAIYNKKSVEYQASDDPFAIK